MASMQFRYDGLRRAEPKHMCFFAPRYRRDYGPPPAGEAPREEGKEITAQQEQQAEPQQASQVEQYLPQAEQQVQQAEQREEQAMQAKQAEQAGEEKQEEETRPAQQAGEIKQQAQQVAEKKQQAQQAGEIKQQAQQAGQQAEQAKQKVGPSTLMISEILIDNLAQTEGQIERVKEQVDYARIVLDEFLFKIDSILQILGIVRANETKSASLTAATAVSYKSSKDSLDELLELFQGPVFQKILRQILIQVFIPESGGTNFARQS